MVITVVTYTFKPAIVDHFLDVFFLQYIIKTKVDLNLCFLNRIYTSHTPDLLYS